MMEKGVTMEGSPSGIGMGIFSSHLTGSGGSPWEHEPQQKAIIAKLPATAQNGLSRNSESNGKEKTNRRRDDQTNVNRSCGCGGWVRADQLEHDLAELKMTHTNLLTGLHQTIDSLKQKNRDLTFQLYMGPIANVVKQDDTSFISEEAEGTSDKNKTVPTTEGDTKTVPQVSHSNLGATDSTLSNTTTAPTTTSTSTSSTMNPLEEKQTLINNDLVIRRPQRGRSARGDPRLVRSLDLDYLLLDAAADNTGQEWKKNSLLTTINVQDHKRQICEKGDDSLSVDPPEMRVGATPKVLPPPRLLPRSPPSRRTQSLRATALPSSSPHARQMGQRDKTLSTPQANTVLLGAASPPLCRRWGDRSRTQRAPYLPPLPKHYHQQERSDTVCPNYRKNTERCTEHEGMVTLPAISSGPQHQQKHSPKPHHRQQQQQKHQQLHQERQQQHQQHLEKQQQQQYDEQQQPQFNPHYHQQQRSRGKHFGRGRARRHHGHQSDQQQQQHLHVQQYQQRPSSENLQEGYTERDKTEAGNSYRRRNTDAPNQGPSSSSSSGRRAGKTNMARGNHEYSECDRNDNTHFKLNVHENIDAPHSEDGNEIQGNETDHRQDMRSKGRGRAHRRGGRGRPRKDKPPPPHAQNYPESEQ